MYEHLDPNTIHNIPDDHFAWVFDNCLNYRELTQATYLLQLEQGVFVATPDAMSGDYLLVPAPITLAFKNHSRPVLEPYFSEEARAYLDREAIPKWQQ